MRRKDRMKVEYLKVEEIKPYERNPKLHSDEQIEMIAKSIKEFGMVNPIIVDRNNEVVAGHARLLACIQLGMEKVPVLRAEWLTPEQVRAYRIADNRLAEMAQWDSDLLKLELDELRDSGFEVELTGFNLDVDFHPILEPKEIDHHVTEEDIKNVNLSVEKERRQREVICPYCAQTFYIDEEE